ncbi:MAG: CPBP family intramembrane metalloprotease [Erysipelotrichaceae bacterium]|nr:CPBP family intramembrane metalloprotease [Erysipelotrichaceae bacterium]
MNKKITHSVSKAAQINIGYQLMPALFVLLLMNEYQNNDQWMWVEIVMTVFTGTMMMLIYRKQCPDYFVPVKKMRLKTFISFVCLLALAQIIALGIQFCMRLSLQMSPVEFIKSMGNVSQVTLPFVIFTAVVAPVFEEIVFRGMGLQELSKHSHLLAIGIGSVLFGCAHHSVYTIPFALMSGIVFSYVYLNYSIYASMALHFFNNGIFAVLFSAVALYIPVMAYVQWGILFIFAIFGGVYLYKNRIYVRDYMKVHSVEVGGYSSAFHSKLFWTYLIFVLVMSTFTIFS